MYNKEELLKRIADELDLSDTELKNVVQSYEAVGEFLNNNINTNKFGKIIIFPQGSVALGTVVKPINENDYDVDMVCKFESLSISLDDVKSSVGRALNSSDRYAKMLDDEGKRCWTLNYKDYHMDILPTKLNNNPIIKYGEPSILATHKENKFCPILPKDTNPRGYLKWFLERCDSNLNEQRKHFSIEKLTDYSRKTILQKTVQLLKRHRDLYFDNGSPYGKDNKPISIIITTLAAKAYNFESTLLDALFNVSNTMSSYIEYDNQGNALIMSPVDAKENFADKWTNKIKLYAFNDWIEQLKKDIQKIKTLKDEEVGSLLKQIFGDKPVIRVFDSIGSEFKDLRESGQLKFDSNGRLTNNSGETVINHTFYGKEIK